MEKKYHKISDIKLNLGKAKARWLSVILIIVILFLTNIGVGYFILSSDSPGANASTLSNVFLIENAGTSGTGFLVSSSYVLTAAHVAGSVGTNVNLTNRDGLSTTGTVVASGYDSWVTFKINEEQVRPGATEHDWSLIELSSEIVDIDPWYIGSSMDVSQTSTVFLCGHPGGQELTTTKGIVSRIEQFEIRTDAEVDPGFSGGPMILVEDDDINNGSVIGIIVSKPVELSSIKSAVPIDVVLEKCSDAGYIF